MAANDFTLEFKRLVRKHLRARRAKAWELHEVPKQTLARNCCTGCVREDGECDAGLSDFDECGQCLKHCPEWPGVVLIWLSMAPLVWMLLASEWILLNCIAATAVQLTLGILWFCAAPRIFDAVRQMQISRMSTHIKKEATMNKSELEKTISKNTGVSLGQTKEVVNELIDQVADALHRGESVTIAGLGKFEMRGKNTKHFTNPKTGEVRTLPARRSPGFKFGEAFKARLGN